MNKYMAPFDITFHIYDYVHQDECIIICIFNLRKYIYIYTNSVS